MNVEPKVNRLEGQAQLAEYRARATEDLPGGVCMESGHEMEKKSKPHGSRSTAVKTTVSHGGIWVSRKSRGA